MSKFYLPDAQAALGFVRSQTSYIETQVAEIQYPDIQYPQLIPVDTSANEWAKSITYYSSDKRGRAGWFHARGKDLHYADVERTAYETEIEMADIGYRYDLEEIGQAMMIPGTNLPVERAAAADRAYNEFVDNVALRGASEKNLDGLINYPGITSVIAAEVGGHTLWDDKDGDDIMNDVNAALSGIHVGTLQVEIADTILLPLLSMSKLATKRLGDTETTVLSFLQKNNVYTMQTGRPLLVRGVRGLENAGVGGSGRMVAYRRDPSVLKMHIPMTHRFLPVFQSAPLVFDIPGIFRLGGLEIRRPASVRYVDGIETVDTPS